MMLIQSTHPALNIKNINFSAKNVFSLKIYIIYMYSCIAIKCYYPLNIEKHFTYFDNIIRFYTCLKNFEIYIISVNGKFSL